MVERLCMCGAGSMWEFSVLSAQFCCEYKTALKKKKEHVPYLLYEFPVAAVTSTTSTVA